MVRVRWALVHTLRRDQLRAALNLGEEFYMQIARNDLNSLSEQLGLTEQPQWQEK